MLATEQASSGFDIGKALQLLQSFLLVCTFLWALQERKQYRLSDKFGKYGLEYVADALDELHSDTRDKLEEMITGLLPETYRKETEPSSGEITPAECIAIFNRRLFYTRSIIFARLRCFPNSHWVNSR